MQAVPAQLTIRAIVLGILLSVVLAGANAYLGLFVGLTVSASIPAAVISMAILKIFRDSNILENNIVQTAASAGESLAAGVIFTIPALILIGYWDTFDYRWVTVIAMLGGFLGVLFTIPLRRSLIVEQKLTFPEGAATAEVLKVGNDPAAGIKYLALGGLTGAVVKFFESGLRVWPGSASHASYLGNSTIGYVGTNLSPALIGVGYIVGLNIATLVFVGGCISWYIAIPLYATFGLEGDPALLALFESGTDANTLAGTIWNTKVRYLGVGAMLIGGIWALISMRKSLVSGIKSGFERYSHVSEDGGVVEIPHTERDTPMKIVMIGIAAFVVPMFFLYQNIVGSFGVGLTMTLIMVIAGFLFSSVAGYMAGLVGSSNNPISGITIATILFASLILLSLLGQDAANGPAAAIMIGAVVCCAAAIAGDNMQDLKAGYILGATPWKQQVMQGVGVASAAVVIAPVLTLLLTAYGIGPASAENPNSLAAPQAALMASVSAGVFGNGLPWNWVWAGVVIGAVIIFIDTRLAAANATFRAPVLAVAVGIYLPLELSVPIFIGGLVAWLAQKAHMGRGADDVEGRMRGGMLFAAGLITGEALLGIFMAIPIAAAGSASVVADSVAALLGLESLSIGTIAPFVGLVVVGGVVVWLYNVASANRTTV
ncbi:MAG: oligopeptide transporter, OPT family [Pseudomonadota bacterium]